MIEGEFQLIRKINRFLGKPPKDVLIGIGDDAAVVRSPGQKLVLTVDSQIEGTHFIRKYSKPEDIGHKALAVNLSDMAAMGGTPRYALVSLGLTSKLTDAFVLSVYRGLNKLARQHGVAIIGGNIARTSGPFFLDVTLVGTVKRKAVLRSGARKSDLIAVTGDLGAAAAGLACLKRGKRNPVTQRHTRPEPKVAIGKRLGESGLITSMIDISDGLASELHHLSEHSKVGFRILADQIPIHRNTQLAGKQAGKDPLKWALYGGEDYELLFTFAPKYATDIRKVGVPYTVIGTVTGTRVEIVQGEKSRPLPKRGWDHFV